MDLELLASRRVGTTLRGKWRLESLLGVGGMAAVYVGAHAIGRRDAIKILHPQVARSAELRARFQREAHAVNLFKHPGAVEIRDIDETEDGAPFLVMELLEGESLAERAQRPGGVALDELLRLTDELLGVLVAAHAQGIIHRDIKPDNLFVQRDGRLKVLDFGIARVRDGSDLVTRAGAALGTVPYMAPEQIKGGDVDARIDLFAVGATMFRLVANRRVHEAEAEAMLLVKMATVPAPPLASVAPGAPEGVCLVVDCALQFDRDKRYPDALAMQADLQALRAGRAPPGEAVPRAAPAPPPAAEHTVAAAPLAIAMASPAAPVPVDPAPSPAPESWTRAALEPTVHAPVVVPAEPAGLVPPVADGRPSRQRAADERRVLVVMVPVLLGAIILVGALMMAAMRAPSRASDPPNRVPAVDPDDPSWRPSSSKRPAGKPASASPRRGGRGDDE